MALGGTGMCYAAQAGSCIGFGCAGVSAAMYGLSLSSFFASVHRDVTCCAFRTHMDVTYVPYAPNFTHMRCRIHAP